PEVVASLRGLVGNRIEATVILAGEETVSGGTFSQASGDTNRRNVGAKVSKLGGAGDAGHKQPLGDLPLRWQPRFQGSFGYLKASNDFVSGVLAGDRSDDTSIALQFGGGARVWFDDHFSFATTLVGMYGHVENDYTARGAFTTANLQQLQQAGLVDWTA